MSEIGVHKETFSQGAQPGIPLHWVVFYWPSHFSPASGMHECAYFGSLADAVEFEGTLQTYDDWYSSQEMTLAVQ